MRRFLLMLILSGCFFTTYSQGSSALPAGGKQLNFGLPGYVGLDFALNDMFTMGPKISLGIFDNSNSLKLGVVADFHFNTITGMTSEWDAYMGLSAGWILYDKPSDDYKDGLNLGGQLGGRYFWNDTWGANVEIGFSGSVGGGIGLTMLL